MPVDVQALGVDWIVASVRGSGLEEGG